jgi:hypothetical protein
MSYVDFCGAIFFSGVIVFLIYLAIALAMEYLFLANMDIFHEICIPIAFFFWGFFTKEYYLELIDNED